MSDKPIVYEDDNGVICYRASALGGCLKALALARAGYEGKAPPAQLQIVFDSGHDYETVALKHLEDMGYTISMEQSEVRFEFGDGKIAVVGHIDGMAGLESVMWEDRVLEVKSQSPDMFTAWTPRKWTEDPLWQKYAWQISTYMHAIGGEALLARIERSEAEKFDVAVIETPFHTRGEIIARIMEVEQMAQRADLETVECGEEYGCPFFYLHKAKEPREMVEDARLHELVDIYNESNKRAKRWGHDKEIARKEIVARMAELGHSKIQMRDGTQVSVVTTEVKEHIVKASTQTRVTVKVPDPAVSDAAS